MRFLPLAALAILLQLFAACGGGNEVATSETQPVPDARDLSDIPPSTAEIDSITVSSYQQILDAHDAVLRSAIALSGKEFLYSRALFNEIRPKSTASRAEASRLAGEPLVTTGTSSSFVPSKREIQYFFSYLRDVRFKYVPQIALPQLVLIPLESFLHALSAEKKAKESFSFCYKNEMDAQDTKLDAVRHAYWNALMTTRWGSATAEGFANNHEGEADPRFSRTAMDLHNNIVGRRLALRFPSATSEQLLELLLESKFEFFDTEAVDGAQKPPTTPLSTDPDALVFFSKKEMLDGSHSGSITNPDSGGPWLLTTVFSQCGPTVRGIMTLVRGAAQQKRRFSGTVNAGAIALQMADPFVFENPENLYYCQNMQANLSGNGATFTGPWTSNNCRLGGSISIEK